MISKSLLLAATAAAAAGAIAVPQTAAAQTAPISTIYSAAQNTCLDTSTTDPGQYFLDTYGHPCSGNTTQNFAFQAVAGTPATYQIVSQANGLCIGKLRWGVRQAACSSYTEWTLHPVGAGGNQYQFAAPSTYAYPNADCIQVSPTPNGYPGPLFDLAGCSSDPAQILTLGTTP